MHARAQRFAPDPRCNDEEGWSATEGKLALEAKKKKKGTKTRKPPLHLRSCAGQVAGKGRVVTVMIVKRSAAAISRHVWRREPVGLV